MTNCILRAWTLIAELSVHVVKPVVFKMSSPKTSATKLPRSNASRIHDRIFDGIHRLKPPLFPGKEPCFFFGISSVEGRYLCGSTRVEGRTVEKRYLVQENRRGQYVLAIQSTDICARIAKIMPKITYIVDSK